jgi:two-component system, NarL family, response regulator DegU
MIGLMIVSPRPLIREGLAIIIQRASNLHLMGAIATTDSIGTFPVPLPPQVVLLDTGVDPWFLLRSVKRLGHLWPTARILAIVPNQAEPVKATLAQSGFPCWLSDETEMQPLLEQISLVANSDSCCRAWNAGIRQRPVGGQPLQGLATLTPREHCVLEMLAHGYPNKEIADRLNLRELTVKSYLKVIYDKLGVTNRVEAASVWRGWRSPNEVRPVGNTAVSIPP